MILFKHFFSRQEREDKLNKKYEYQILEKNPKSSCKLEWGRSARSLGAHLIYKASPGAIVGGFYRRSGESKNVNSYICRYIDKREAGK